MGSYTGHNADFPVTEMDLRRILDQGRSTKEIRKYLQWLHRTYASETNLQTEIVGGRLVFVHAITCQAVGLALFMEACDYEGELEAIYAEKCGYSRQFKE